MDASFIYNVKLNCIKFVIIFRDSVIIIAYLFIIQQPSGTRRGPLCLPAAAQVRREKEAAYVH